MGEHAAAEIAEPSSKHGHNVQHRNEDIVELQIYLFVSFKGIQS